jgi:hypothetical protein
VAVFALLWVRLYGAEYRGDQALGGAVLRPVRDGSGCFRLSGRFFLLGASWADEGRGCGDGRPTNPVDLLSRVPPWWMHPVLAANGRCHLWQQQNPKMLINPGLRVHLV